MSKLDLIQGETNAKEETNSTSKFADVADALGHENGL